MTATVGAIGAAAAISNLLRLDATTTAHALGIAGAVLLAAHVALRRWPARSAPP